MSKMARVEVIFRGYDWLGVEKDEKRHGVGVIGRNLGVKTSE